MHQSWARRDVLQIQFANILQRKSRNMLAPHLATTCTFGSNTRSGLCLSHPPHPFTNKQQTCMRGRCLQQLRGAAKLTRNTSARCTRRGRRCQQKSSNNTTIEQLMNRCQFAFPNPPLKMTMLCYRHHHGALDRQHIRARQQHSRRSCKR